MKILWISHVIPYPPKSGVLLRAFHLLRSVAERHEVDLFAFIQEPWLRTFFDSRDNGLAQSHSALSEFCQDVTFVPIERLQRRAGKMRTAFEALFEAEGYIANWLRSDEARAQLIARSECKHYDLVHLDTIALAGYRTLFPTVPATLNHHNIESEMLIRRAENQRNPIKRWYFGQEGRRLRRFEQRTSPGFSKHIVCSDLDAARWHEIAPAADTAVVPNGVDCGYFCPQGLPQRPDSLIFVGTMSWYPNADAVLFLLRAIWPAIHKARPGATLDLVGANAPREVRALAAKVPGVTLRGFVPDVRPLIDAAALYVCPIRDGGGTKLKILDACAMGKCVIAHPIACEGLALEAGKHVVLASTAEHTVAAILQLLDDPNTRRRIGEAARRRMLEQYSFDSIGAALSELLVQVEPRAPMRRSGVA